MCGIVAIRFADGAVSGGALERATSALRHRGPDDERTWLSESAGVGLGHTRLSIIDPDGVQPIESEDSRVRIVVNGEFYGFEEIRRTLEGKGHRFRTRSDSEIALHLYEDLGSGCLEHLRGEFAFVIWDGRTRKLFAARDRFGIKPLFYTRSGGSLYLASEAKALFAAGVPCSWDLRGVYHTLLACPDESISLFGGVSQLPPGHYLTVGDDGIPILTRYWDVGSVRDRVDASADQVQERVRSLVEESVRLRMRADVPVGCLLSGGLDSSAALGIAATCTERPVGAFTIGFEEDAYDESPGATEMARSVGADHHLVRVTGQDLAEHFSDAVWHAETVQYNAHGTARYLLSRAVRDAGYKCVLAGEGADEMFFGYEFTLAASKAGSGSKLGLLWRIARGLLRSPSGRYPGLASASPWLARLATILDVSPALLSRLDAGLSHLRSTQDERFLDGFARDDIYRAYYRRCNERAGISRWEPSRQLVYLWLHSIFANYHLAADRLDMAHGVETRLPFLDHRLFEYTQQLPLELLATPENVKGLLRDAARPYVTDAVYERRKKPFWAPPSAARASGPLNQLVQDTLRGQAASDVPFLNRTRTIELLDRVPEIDAAAQTGVDSLLLLLTSLVILQERYGPSA